MNNFFKRGSEWRKWDLHIHTKGTSKNDKFTSTNFDSFCVTLFRKALKKDIKAIAITDYFSIDNYKKVKDFFSNIDSSSEFDDEEKSNIKNIFLLPNVELRILPATDSGGLINIHCIFNPDTTFLAKLENDFFASLEDSGGNKMNRAGLIALGKNSDDDNLDDNGAYKKGIEKFHLEPSKLISLFKDKPELKENTIIAVSNSSKDGASALQKHYELFENELGTLYAVRNNIYKLSEAVFSANPTDRDFFLGERSGCDESLVINKCGSLKPCVHGSDAHCEDKLFNPDKKRFCWIKADLTFEGLKQILCEPKDRVRIQANKPEEKSGYHIIK
ncbi:ATPase involved in DNA repair, partial [uncultured Gammaproteobacteria bacterium]